MKPYKKSLTIARSRNIREEENAPFLTCKEKGNKPHRTSGQQLEEEEDDATS